MAVQSLKSTENRSDHGETMAADDGIPEATEEPPSSRLPRQSRSIAAKVIDLELARAARMEPARFGQISNHEPGFVTLDFTGRFTPAAARILARAILELADAADREAKRRG